MLLQLHEDGKTTVSLSSYLFLSILAIVLLFALNCSKRCWRFLINGISSGDKTLAHFINLFHNLVSLLLELLDTLLFFNYDIF